MSSTVDVNVLVYASDETSRFHRGAAGLLERLARGPELVWLFWPVLMGYLRIVTHPAILSHPMTQADAEANLDALLGLPYVRIAGEADGFWTIYLAGPAALSVRGNAVPDSHLVGLMLQHGVATLWTHDRDFRRFDGITVRDPFGD